MHVSSSIHLLTPELADLVSQDPVQSPDAGGDEQGEGGGGGGGRGSFTLDEEEDAAAIAAVEEACREGTPLNVSEGLASYLQDYQQYLEPSFREAMIAAQVI
jgi:hypothetical protein